MFVAGVLLMTLFGAFTWRMESVRRMDLAARVAIAFACGVVVGGVVMFAYSVIGIPWQRWTLAIPLVLAAALWRRDAARPAGGTPALLIFVLLTIYGVATARETTGDLLYFWGPKAQRFFLESRIDVGFLQFPHYYLMHPDYPPLQTLIYSWGAIAAHRFSWWGALYLTPVFLLASVLVFRGYSRNKGFAILLAAVLAYGIGSARSAGGADPLLYLFEVIALCALTFDDDSAIASIALTGAVLTKVEGAAFAIVVLVALVITRRIRALKVFAAPALALGAWILFAKHHGLLDAYARGKSTLHFEQLGMVVKRTLGAFILPWIAAIAPLTLGRNWKRAALPLLVAAGTLAYTIFFYLHEADPAFWIKTSAERVLLTTVIALIVAGAAASSDENVC
ncbi:MAG TPA: hypothetical protein VMU84_00730 [Thermoanaerobaculia bacterium]|nr:hypothetical protein [Thermoanaerobaculia bacterium]